MDEWEDAIVARNFIGIFIIVMVMTVVFSVGNDEYCKINITNRT